MGGGTEHASSIFYGERGVTARQRAGRARDRAPVVRQRRHRERLERRLAQRGLRDLLHLLYTEHASGRDAFVEGLRRSRATVLRVAKAQPDIPVVHDNFNEAGSGGPNTQLAYQKGGVGSAHAARSDRHRGVLARHPDVLPAIA